MQHWGLRLGTLVAVSLVPCSCLPDPMDAGEQATPAPNDETDVATVREAFTAVDWRGLCGAAFEDTHTTGKRGVIGITPPGENFSIAMVSGPISTDSLDTLLTDVEARLREVLTSTETAIERRYPVTEIPDKVVDGVLLSSKRPLATCKGFGFELRCGPGPVHAEVVATPLEDEWRIDIYLREPMK